MALSKQTGIIAGGAAALLAVTATMFTLMSSNVLFVAPSEDLQAAINQAPCGAVIEVQAGAVYPVNLTLPKKDCAEFITIQSSRASELPQGERINPATQSALLATLESTINAEPVIQTASGAHHYKLIGLRAKTQSESVFVYDLVRFDNGSHHLILDRSWVHGNGEQETQRGVTLNCADCQVINSHITNIKGKGMDTQAVCGWNGTLRAQVINSYLEAAGENIMFGGADPANEQMIPSLIEIRRNTIAKLLEWRGKGYTIKNLIELKNCINCTIDGNLIENNWGNEGQSGAAIVITVRNQDCHAPWSTIQNGTFTNNIVKNSDGVFNFLGKDNEAEPTYLENGKPKCGDAGESFGSVRGNAFLVANNVFDKITGAFITINGFYNVTVENNTDLQTCGEGCNTTTFYGEQSMNYIHRNNVHDEKAYGLTGDGSPPGQPTLDRYAPNAVVTGNVVVRPYAPWPSGNEAVDVLTITSDYRTPYVGKGANVDAILAAMAGVGPTQPSPSPSVTATVAISPSPIPTATATGTPSPTPTPTATPTPTPTPTPRPTASPVSSPSPLPFCQRGERPGNPPRCRCRNGFQGSSGKCR